MGVATILAIVWVNTMTASGHRRIGPCHRVALVPRAATIQLTVIVSVIAGMDSVRVDGIAVQLWKVTANAMMVHGFSPTVDSLMIRCLPRRRVICAIAFALPPHELIFEEVSNPSRHVATSLVDAVGCAMLSTVNLASHDYDLIVAILFGDALRRCYRNALHVLSPVVSRDADVAACQSYKIVGDRATLKATRATCKFGYESTFAHP